MNRILRPSRYRSPRPALVVAMLVLVALLILLPVTGLAVVNRLVVPRATAAGIARAEALTGGDVTVDEARLSFARGLVVRGLRVDDGPSGTRVVVREVRVRVTASLAAAAIRLARGRIDVPGAPPATVPFAGGVRPDPFARIWALVRGAAAARMVPPGLDLRGISAGALVVGRPIAVDVPHARILHDERRERLSIAADLMLHAQAPRAGRTGDADAALPAGSVSILLDYGREQADARLTIADLPLAVAGPADGILDAQLAVTSVPGSPYAIGGLIHAREASVTLPSVAPEPVGPLDVEYRFATRLEPWTERSPRYRVGPPIAQALPTPDGVIRVEEGTLTVNGVTLRVRPELRGLFGPPAESLAELITGARRTLRLRVTLPDTPVRAIRDAVPDALLGELRHLELDGTFGWDLDLSVPLHAMGEMTYEASSRLDGFAVREISRATNPYLLARDFDLLIRDPVVGYERLVRIPPPRLPSVAWALEHSEHSERWIRRWRDEAAVVAGRVTAAPPRVVDGDARPVATPPGVAGEHRVGLNPNPDPSYRYVRLEQMSPWVVRAVLTAEDGDYFFHDGVNFTTLPRALERNVRAGEIQFGASTIPMQLAKTLFLDQDRIVARKLQEVFLVFLMEHQVGVTKERLLELYLNIVEFGPGVFGIADAARYYFAKDPAALTAGEATWLASVLPSPKRFHQYYEAGWISDGWFERMKSYFDIMLERGRMTAEEYAQAVAARPVFTRRPDDP